MLVSACVCFVSHLSIPILSCNMIENVQDVEDDDEESRKREKGTQQGWRTSSLGCIFITGSCPQPGFMYAQVITPGYRVVLEYAGKQYIYHTDMKKTVAPCYDTHQTN